MPNSSAEIPPLLKVKKHAIEKRINRGYLILLPSKKDSAISAPKPRNTEAKFGSKKIVEFLKSTKLQTGFNIVVNWIRKEITIVGVNINTSFFKIESIYFILKKYIAIVKVVAINLIKPKKSEL